MIKFDRGANRPAERWIAMIRRGDKPSDATAGGFAALKALEWVKAWAAASGVDVSPMQSEGR